MKALRRFLTRLRSPWRRDELEREMDEELGAILELLVDERLRKGIPPREARRQALIALGGLEQIKEAGRDAHRLRFFEATLSDLRLALRKLARTPVFTAVAILTLALGIGVNTALFSIIYGVLLRPLALTDPDSLVVFQPGALGSGAFPGFSPAYLEDWQKNSSSFEGIAAWVSDNVRLFDGDTTEALDNVLAVTGNFFSVLGVDAVLGRPLEEQDAVPNSRGNVVVLGKEFWRSRFGEDPAVLGKTLWLDEQPYLVVGVMPAHIPLPPNIKMWFPQDFDAEDESYAGRLMPVGRLRQGVSRERATAEMERLVQAVNETHPSAEVKSLALLPVLDSLTATSRPMLLIMAAAVVLVLLITCANLANLMLARASIREREMATRRSLGADRWQILRLVLTESLALASFGAVAGLGLALLAHRVVATQATGILPRLDSVQLDAPVIAFAFALALLSGLLFGLAPTLHALSVDMGQATRGSSRGTVGQRGLSRTRSTLLVGQVALASVLLVAAGLLLRSVIALAGVDPGFKPEGVVAGRINLDEHTSNDAKEAAYFRRLIEHLRATPGITRAGACTGLPIDPVSLDFMVGWERPEAPTPAGQEPPSADLRAATPGYFATLGIPLLEGRDFEELDRGSTQRVAIVNRTLARQAFGEESPLGKELSVYFADFPIRVRFRVVGVVGDLLSRGLRTEHRPEVFVAEEQVPISTMTVVVRGDTSAASLAETLRQAVLEVDSTQPIETPFPVTSLLSSSLANDRFALIVMALFAALALLLAAAGIYGVIDTWVKSCRKEIGLRLALGAARSHVMAQVVRRSLLVTVVGLGVGLSTALAGGRLLSGLVFRVTAADPAILGSVSLLLGLVALIASYWPALEASRVDPLTTLRSD